MKKETEQLSDKEIEVIEILESIGLHLAHVVGEIEEIPYGVLLNLKNTYYVDLLDVHSELQESMIGNINNAIDRIKNPSPEEEHPCPECGDGMLNVDYEEWVCDNADCDAPKPKPKCSVCGERTIDRDGVSLFCNNEDCEKYRAYPNI